MKLLFLNTNIGYGGASKMIAWVANQCAKNGHSVTFLTYRDNVIRQPIDDSIKIHHKQLEGGDTRGNIIASIMWLHNYIKDNSFDLGIAFLSPSILRMAFAAKGTKMKVLFSHRSDPYYKTPNNTILSKIISWINEWAFKQADAFVFQTEMAKGFYSEKIQNRSYVIPNPIKPLLRTEVRNGNIRKSFVAIGRLDLKQKRQDIMISAFNIVSSKYPDYYLEIYGDGEDEEKIRKLAATNPKILLMGKTDDVVSVLQNAYASVLSSDFEGIPNALLESMSIGLPSISTDCSPGGASMLIRNYENGIIVPKGNYVQLAAAMEYMILHPEQAEAMGKRGMEVNQLYAEHIISDQWLRIIQKQMR